MEGPQTRALADHLNDLLTGRPVGQILVPEHRWQANVLLLNCVGQVLQRVRSHGKWLFFDFSHGTTWLCQLIMRAKWKVHTAPPAEPQADRPRRTPLMTVHFFPPAGKAGETRTAVLTGHPIFYILPTEKVRHHPDIKNLGPDPLASSTFFDEFPYRLRQNPSRTLASALLDQQVVAGLGNTLKSEILFAMRFPPSQRVAALLASQIDRLAATIVGLAATATTFAVRGEPYPYRVFDRAGTPCGNCNTPITVDRSGQDGLLTWYCPACQPNGEQPSLFAT
jgi:endonuclease VIII